MEFIPVTKNIFLDFSLFMSLFWPHSTLYALEWDIRSAWISRKAHTKQRVLLPLLRRCFPGLSFPLSSPGLAFKHTNARFLQWAHLNQCCRPVSASNALSLFLSWQQWRCSLFTCFWTVITIWGLLFRPQNYRLVLLKDSSVDLDTWNHNPHPVFLQRDGSETTQCRVCSGT